MEIDENEQMKTYESVKTRLKMVENERKQTKTNENVWKRIKTAETYENGRKCLKMDKNV